MAKASREANLQRILDTGIVAVVRAPSSDDLISVVKALYAGGVECIEITMTTPNALEVIKASVEAIGDKALIGVGTVLDPETARMAINAGAQYVVTPTLNLDVIRLCKRYSRVIIPGAFTPTEILTAWEAGADIVKVFPATALGPKYFKDIKGPLPHVRLTPTGGVDLDTIGEFIRCGADCVAVGGNMVKKELMAAKDYDGLTALARKFAEAVRAART